MDPRWYQSEAVASCWDFIRSKSGNPCIVLPTGAGKSLVIAMIARDVVGWNGRCLVLAHRKELLEQNAEKISHCLPGLDVGVYSAGLGRKDHSSDVVVAGVQSCFKKQAAYNLGHRDVVIVDEAHLIPLEGEGMYRQLIEHLLAINPLMRIIGLTATPYRLDHGMVCGPEALLQEVCYEVPLVRLIEEGFLCPLVSKSPAHLMDLEGVGTRGGEFIQAQLDEHSAKADVVRAAVLELISWTMDRHSVLIFACGRKHALTIMEALGEQIPGELIGYVDGLTTTATRAQRLEDFKAGRFKYLVNIDVLTTGFDAPNVDCVALFRPTLSPGLLYQMVGRGFRLHPSKQNCLVLDFAGNIQRHGTIDQLKPPKSKAERAAGDGAPVEAPSKACPKCRELVFIQARECPECGFLFPEPKPKHDKQASDLPVLSNGQPVATREWVEVTRRPDYLVHSKGKADGHRTLRVIYKLRGQVAISEYVCLDHPPGSYARQKAEGWWKSRTSHPVPSSCWEAWWLLKEVPELLAWPIRMELKWIPGQKWPEILRMEMGPSPEVDPEALQAACELAAIKENLFR